MTQRKDTLGDLIRRQQMALNRGKRAYKQADALLDQIQEKMKPGEVVAAGVTEYELVDKFAEKNTVCTPAMCRRFELKEVKS